MVLQEHTEKLLQEADVEEIDDETFYSGLEPINLMDLTKLPSARPKGLEQRSEVSSQISDGSTITIRSGGKISIKRKRKVVEWHKYAFMVMLVVGLLVVPMISYGFYSEVDQGLFRAGEEIDEDILEHEKKVEWDTQDIVAFCCASLLIMIAAGGGIGGGGVLVPTYIFVLGFEPKYAIPLSNCTILGSSLSNLVLNVNKRHPYADRPLIDWDIMLMMEPLTIVGALLGTFINVISPPWLITCMLVILLVATAFKTLNKGIRKYNEETAAMERKSKSQLKLTSEKDLTTPEPIKMDTTTTTPTHNAGGDWDTPKYKNAQPVIAWTKEDVKVWWARSLPPGCQEYIHIIDECDIDGHDLLHLDYRSLSEFNIKKMLIMKILRRVQQLKQSLGISEKASETSEEIYMDDEPRVLEEGDEDPRYVRAVQDKNQLYMDILTQERDHPGWKVAIMFLVTGGMLTFTILKGGGDINILDLSCDDPIYWILTFLAIPYVLIFCVTARNHLLKKYYEKKECGYDYLPQDVQWDERATIQYPLMCSMAGLAAGMFGIGGGIVKGPLMLEMNVYPAVTSATSATMILFTSSGASVSYFIFQQLNVHYASVLFCLGIFFTYIGQVGLGILVKKYKRNSLIILVIGVTVAMSAIMMGIESSSSIADLINGEHEQGKSICNAGGD